jgi:hypothetical protein
MSTNSSLTNTTISQVNIASQKVTVEAQYKALVTGLNEELPDVQSFVINGTPYAKVALVAKLQARIDAAEKTKSDRTKLHASVGAERALEQEVAALRAGTKTFLQSRFGKNSPEMQKFGFTQAKVPQRPVATKATGVAKNKATRQARHTLGKKQKSAIKGTPPVAAASPAA